MTIDVTTITVAQFKAQFTRGFPYLPVYDPAALYNIGNEVYYQTSQLFYNCILNGTTGIVPTNATNWTQTPDDVANWVQDSDITNAFAEAISVFNYGLYGDDQTITLAFLYLTAHFLAADLRAAIAGGIMASANLPVSSRSVGSVSEAYDVPQEYKDSPIFAQYATTYYGTKWLAMTLPATVGNMFSVGNPSHP